jgi:hypothetical protein
MRDHNAWLHVPGSRERREVRCPERGWRWNVEDHTEHGLWLPERDDLTCEECATEEDA